MTDYDFTSLDAVLDAAQQRRMRDIVRFIPETVRQFVMEMERVAREHALENGEISESQRGETDAIPVADAVSEKVIDEFTKRLQAAFEPLPHTTGALARQLHESRTALAARAYAPEITIEQTGFYAGLGPIYARLSETVEQGILFSPEQMPQTERSGWEH